MATMKVMASDRSFHGNLTHRLDTDAYRLGAKGLNLASKSAVFVGADGKLTKKAGGKSSIANVQHEPEVPVFKRKDLLVRATDAMPQIQAQQEALIASILNKESNKKQSSLVDKGQAVTDIDIDELFFYFEKKHRKQLEKAFNGVHFDQMLLSRND